jgi:hypothetical protein
MRLMTNDELFAVAGGDSLYDQLGNYIMDVGNDSEIQRVEIIGQRMTDAEKRAYDVEQEVAATQSVLPNCSVDITFNPTSQSSSANAEVGTTGGKVGSTNSLTTSSPTYKVTCPAKYQRQSQP